LEVAAELLDEDPGLLLEGMTLLPFSPHPAKTRLLMRVGRRNVTNFLVFTFIKGPFSETDFLFKNLA
jgi:hypothetical protein